MTGAAREVLASVRGAEPDVPNLGSGSAGVAALFAAVGDEAERDRLLELALAQLGRERCGWTLYHGVTGVAWVLARSGIEDAVLDEQIDPALVQRCERPGWSDEFDLVNGLAGIGVYALERMDAPLGPRLLEAVVARLDEMATREGDRARWWSPPELLPDWQREIAPRGYVNYGLAHGAPGPIAILAHACAAGVAAGTAEPLLRAAVAELAAHASDDPFPAWIGRDGAVRAARTAWCYGEPGAAAALALAAEAIGEEGWRSLAVELALRAAARPFEETRVADPAICHGAAGLALVYDRLHRFTGHPALAGAAAEWTGRALAMRTPEGRYGGFRALMPDDDGELSPVDHLGLLEGAPSVALALLVVAGEVDPAWVRWLALSS